MLFLLLGLAILFYLIKELGAAQVMDQIYKMGWRLLIILLFPVGIQQVLFVYGWKFSFSEKSSRFPNLFQIHLLGEAFNYIMPGGQMGGEPMKALALRSDIGGVQALGSVIAAKTIKTISMAFFVMTGMLLTINNEHFSFEFKRAVMAAISCFFLFCLFLLFAQHRGLFGPLMRFVEKRLFLIPLKYKEKIIHFDALDLGLKEFYSSRKFQFFLALLFFTVGWMAGFLEIYLILLFLGVEKATLSTALIIEVLSLIINTALFFIPGGIGTQEGGKVFIFKLLAIDPAAGLALGLVRRLRELTWVAIGLLIFAYRPARGEK